jgi:hypothetical protein
MATRAPVSSAAPRVAATEVDDRSYIDWPAVIAGTVIAAAISLILLTFGTAIGLSMTSPYAGEGVSRNLFAIILGIWVVWVIVSSNIAGGYVAGRMRRRIGDATEDESDVRDGIHGATMWGLGVLVAAALTLGGVSGLAIGGAAVASASGGGGNAVGYTVDEMFRTTGGEGPAGVANNSAAMFAAKREVTRILARGTAGQPISDADKAYVSRLVAQRTGLSQSDAEARVNNSLASAKRTADATRKAGVISGFVLAAALLAGGAAACWSAILGGRHRDRNTRFALWG